MHCYKKWIILRWQNRQFWRLKQLNHIHHNSTHYRPLVSPIWWREGFLNPKTTYNEYETDLMTRFPTHSSVKTPVQSKERSQVPLLRNIGNEAFISKRLLLNQQNVSPWPLLRRALCNFYTSITSDTFCSQIITGTGNLQMPDLASHPPSST